jgi:hypothetical protein
MKMVFDRSLLGRNTWKIRLLVKFNGSQETHTSSQDLMTIENLFLELFTMSGQVLGG